MTFTQLVAFFEEAYGVIQEMKTSGDYDKLVAAEATVADLLKNPKAQDLFNKLLAVVRKV